MTEIPVAMEKLYSFASALLVVFLSCTTAQSPLPVLSDCSPCWCDSVGNCPDPREVCPEILNCNTGVVKDKCGCCYVCLKSIGEMCKREPHQKDEERCDRGLQCLPGEDTWKCEDFKPENLKISRCEKMGKDRCYDLVTRKSYRNGEIWIRGDFTCTACECESSGQLYCWSIKCNVPRCKDPVRVEGRCCEFCLDSDAKKVCHFNGKTFFQSEIIVLQDRKTICQCQKSRGWVCEEGIKRNMQPLNESPQCVDPLSRRVFKKGEMWRLSECAHCVCGESNTGSCSVVRCPTPRCNDPFKIKGICCPACPQDYQEVCHFEGKKYFRGELIVLPDRCTSCTCVNSQWQCSSWRCSFTKMIKEPLAMRRD